MQSVLEPRKSSNMSIFALRSQTQGCANWPVGQPGLLPVWVRGAIGAEPRPPAAPIGPRQSPKGPKSLTIQSGPLQKTFALVHYNRCVFPTWKINGLQRGSVSGLPASSETRSRLTAPRPGPFRLPFMLLIFVIPAPWWKMSKISNSRDGRQRRVKVWGTS